MAGEITVTYSPRSKGWTSFWSFYPDWMLGLNSTFYTWKDGNLYEHDSSAALYRNDFYLNFANNQYYHYNSTITTIFNQDPTTNKMFKTLALESTDTWQANITTDLESASVLESYYDEKEGSWFAYIRNESSSIIDPNSISTQGVGRTNFVNPLGATIFFPYNIPSNVSVGDRAYKINNNVTTYLGDISSISANGMTYVPDPLGTPPVVGDMIFIVKNNVAESFGVRGYYMEVELINDSLGEVELFELETSAFKSFP
jgi:hypothetical protein